MIRFCINEEIFERLNEEDNMYVGIWVCKDVIGFMTDQCQIINGWYKRKGSVIIPISSAIRLFMFLYKQEEQIIGSKEDYRY